MLMATRYVFSILLILMGNCLFAQDFETDYSVLKNTGAMPIDLLSSSSQKYRQRKKAISRKDSRKTKKAKSEFYLTSSFVIDELLHSGKILFSDKEITDYVNSVADELLKDDPSLRKKLRFYTVKSSTPNAFATDRGAIFFTLGLLEQLNTESELAFILSHEIAHFTQKHSVNTAVSFDKINRKGNRRKRKIIFRNSKSYDALLKKSNYSKKNEQEADRLGGKRFLKTDYNPQSIIDVFDILEFAHIPLNNDSVSISFLNLENLNIPKKYFLTSIGPPKPMKDNEYSTHPGINERRNKGKKLLINNPKKTGKNFIVSEERFQKAKTTAQFELCDVFLQETKYSDAIYFSSILLKKYPNNRYLKYIKAYALYGMAQYTNANRTKEVTVDYNDAEGYAKQAYKVLKTLTNTPANINLVAARYCWDYHETYPNDKAMSLALRDQVEDLAIYGLEEPSGYFSDSKLDQAKSKPNKYYGRLAFAKIRKDKTFVKMFKDGIRYRKKMDQEDTKKRKKGKKRKNKIALGVKKAVFLNPAYYRVEKKNYSNIQLKYIYSEKRQKDLAKVIKQNAKRVHLNVEILDSHSFVSKNDTKKFNELTLLNNFQEELLGHNMYMIVSSYNRVQPLAKKFNTPIIVNTGNISLRKKPRIMSFPMGVLLSIPPATSSGFKKLFTNYWGLQYSSVVDIEDNRILHKEIAPYKQKDIKAILNMNIYNLLYKMKAKKKK